MRTLSARLFVSLSAALCACAPAAGQVRDDYELTLDVIAAAQRGWQLYLDGDFAGSYNDGHYTNPHESTQVKDFWSDGMTAEYDRDDDGHHETIFLIVNGRLVYVGSVGSGGTFVDVAAEHAELAGQPPSSLRQVAEVRDDYELTVAVGELASRGWQLYLDREFAGEYGGGRYTDPDPATRVKDFWSNGTVAKLDRDSNGHHETIFIVNDGQLGYVGSLGAAGVLVDTSQEFQQFAGQSLQAFLARIEEDSHDE